MSLIIGNCKYREFRQRREIFGDVVLTQLEVDVLREICAGRTNAEIARRRKASRRTVEFQRQNIRRKIAGGRGRRIPTSAEMIVWAAKHGLVA
jgi:DNA-binding CsgD family transcriptional regulator